MERKIHNVLYYIIRGGYWLYYSSIFFNFASFYLLNVGPGAVDNLDVVG
jgi:hypothetical protein